MIISPDTLVTATTAESFREVVRVKTCAYSSGRGVSVRRDVTVMRRLSGRQACLLDETVSAVGAEQAAESIINLHEVEDGLYQLVVCNEKTDRETGIVDDYDLKLVPYDEQR